ncbi:hypothetical protein D3C87_1332690 [compost metagenome]
MNRLIYGLTLDNTRGNSFNRGETVVINRAFTVDRCTQGVNYTAQQATANRNFQNTAGTFYLHAFGQIRVRTHNHGTYGVTLQVQCDCVTVAWQCDHFALHNFGQTVYADDPVADGNNSTFIVSFAHHIELSNALLDQFADFGGIQLHAPVPLRLQDVCQAFKTTANAAINHHIASADNHASQNRLVNFAIQLNFA